MAIRDEDVLPVCNFCEKGYDPYDMHMCAGNVIHPKPGKPIFETIDGHPTACDPKPNPSYNDLLRVLDGVKDIPYGQPGWWNDHDYDADSDTCLCQCGDRYKVGESHLHICADEGLTRQQIGEALDEGRREAWLDANKGFDATSTQVGGDHYRQMKIQPVEFIIANGIGFLAGNVIKYAARYKAKGGSEDVRKIIHYCKLILEFEYGEKS